MKVTVTQANLHKALTMVGRIVGNRTSLPVLANVLLQTESGRLKISATDLEVGLTTRIGAKVDKEGSITVPSRTLVEFVGSVSDENLTLSTEGAVLTIAGARTKATLRGIDAEEFPVIPTVDNKSSLIVHAQSFLQALKQVAVAVAPDDTRPVLAGVYVKWSGQKLVCAATDSYRLAEKTLSLEKEAEEKDAIVPSRSINELIRVMGVVGADQVNIAVQDNQILFLFDDTEFVSRLIDGKYPDYQKIVPQKKTTTAIVEAEEFKSTLRTAAIFAREAANTVKFHFGPSNEIVVNALAEQLGDTLVKMPAEIDGEEADSSFNVRFLTDAAGAINDSKIEFSLSGKFQASLLKGVGAPDYLYIIMPLRTE